jgi:hypothetical protein
MEPGFYLIIKFRISPEVVLRIVFIDHDPPISPFDMAVFEQNIAPRRGASY